MALVKRESSLQRTLILISVLIILALAGLYYFVLQPATESGGAKTVSPATLEQQNRNLRALESSLVSDLEEILGDPRFQDLKQYGDTRIETAPMGKDNPFQPF